MIPVTQTTKDAIEERSRTFRARFLTSLSPETELTCNLTNLTIYTGSGGTYPVPGAVFSSYIEATVQNLSTQIKGTDLYLQVGVVTDSTEWITEGLYRVSKTSVAGTVTNFTAVGRLMSHCQGTYSTSLEYPATLSDVIDELETNCSIDVDASGFNLSRAILEAPSGMDMQVLGMIASLLGGFVTENYLGQIVIKAYGSGDTYDVDLSRFTSRPTFTESEFEVTGLECVVNEGQKFTNGTANITIENAYMTQELFNSACSEYVGYSFYPATAPLALGNPCLEPWDVLKIDDDGTEKIVPCHQIVTHFTGALWQEITSVIDGINDDDIAQVKGSVSEQITNIQNTADSALEATKEQYILQVDYNYTTADSLTLNAQIIQSGVDIHERFLPSCFNWYRKTEDASTPMVLLGTGYSITISRSTMGYGGTVVCEFSYRESKILILPDGKSLLFPNGDRLMVTY